MIGTVNAGWVLPEELESLAEGGDQEVVKELIALFKEDVAERMRLLREAAATGNLALVRAQAHTIKGSADQLGAGNLATTCRHLELDAAHHLADNLERLVAEGE